MKRRQQLTVGVCPALLFVALALEATLSGCHHTSRTIYSDPGVLSLVVVLEEGDREPLPESSSAVNRAWYSFSRWHPPPTRQAEWIQLGFVEEPGGVETRRVHLAPLDSTLVAWPGSSRPGEPVELKCAGDLATVVFAGQLESGETARTGGLATRAAGRMVLETDGTRLAELQEIFGEPPSVGLLVELTLVGTDLEYLRELRSTGARPDLSEAVELARLDVQPESIRQLLASGYAFSAAELVRLARYRVSFDEAIAWRRAGYAPDVEALIYAKTRHLEPKLALAWKAVERELTLEELFWAKQRHLDPAEAAEWREAEYDLSLEQLFWVKQRRLDPAAARAWREARYELSLEKLFWAKQRHVTPEEAAAWIAAGYQFTLEDLYLLKQNQVAPEYGAALNHPDYETLSARELTEFKRSRISAETVERIRRQTKLSDP